MVFRIAGSFLRKAKCHIQEDYRYRYYPLYSALFGGLLYVWVIWPWDGCFVEVLRMYPWAYHLNILAADTICLMIVCLGIVGLFRRGLAAKVLSIAGLYIMSWWWDPFGFVGHLTSDVLWYTFDIPAKYISGFAGRETGGATLLWCGYFLCVYLILRPFLKRGFQLVQTVEARILDKWPGTARFAKPLL